MRGDTLPKVSEIIKILLVGVLGAYILISLLSPQNITVKALDFTVRVDVLGPGYTELAIPPLGSVRAKTHSFPLKLSIGLNNINLDRLRSLIADKPKGVFNELVASFRVQIAFFIVKLLILSFSGGFAGGLILFRSLKPALLAGGVGLLVFGILLGGTAWTFEENAFKEPEFHGIVEVAPWLLSVAEEALEAVNELDNTLEIVATNMMLMFESLGQLAEHSGGEAGLKILHVSDIHNNAVAVSLVIQAAAAFKVDLVVDTGDITDYGTPIEGDLASVIAHSNLPWVFVPGNHDSPAVIGVLEQLDNVTVLKEDVYHLEELNLVIAGIADPSADDYGMGIPTQDQYREAAGRLREVIARSGLQPSIIASHHPLVLEEFTQWPVLLLHGHSHRVNIRSQGLATLIDAGTTGGAGIRGLMSAAQMPYTMVLLHLEEGEDGWRGKAADIITVNQINASFTLERKLLNQSPFQARNIIPKINENLPELNEE